MKLTLSFFIGTLMLIGSLQSQNVGIGTMNPVNPLHVIGPSQFDVTSTGGHILLTAPGTQPGMVIFSNSPDNHRADIARNSNSLTFAAHASSGGPPPTQMVLTNDGRVGIGTTNPTAELQVNGVGIFYAPGSATGQIALTSPAGQPGIIFASNAPDNFRADIARHSTGLLFGVGASAASVSSRMFIHNNGYVGIGTNTPSHKLHVMDRAKFDGAAAGLVIEAGTADWFVGRNASNLRFYHGGFDWVTMKPGGVFDVRQSFSTGNGTVFIKPQNTSNEGGEVQLLGAANYATWNIDNYAGNFRIFSNGAERLRIHSTGKISIGTNSIPGNHKLYVNGSIMSTRVKVAVLGSPDWADYVFDESYELKSLEEVDQHIKEHKHLPDVPSTAEMMESGNDLGKTDALLLSKIEELFLHSIEMNEEMKELKERVLELEEENSSLKKKLKE